MPDRRDKLAEVRSSVDADITLAWSRKDSIEVRAGNIVVSNLAISTLFFLVYGALGYSDIAVDGPPRVFLIAALILALVSTLAMTSAATLFNYPGLDGPAYEQALADLESDPTLDMQLEVVEARIDILDGATRATTKKAVIYLIGFSAFGAAMACYVLTVILSALTP